MALDERYLVFKLFLYGCRKIWVLSSENKRAGWLCSLLAIFMFCPSGRWPLIENDTDQSCLERRLLYSCKGDDNADI
jgi:hypothetical protein